MSRYWPAALILLIAGGLFAARASAQSDDLFHLRLVDRLDRPADGYCLDILGVGKNMRLEVPVFAHNCKPALTADSAVEFTEDGEIRFVAVDLCVTAAGVNARALPGVAILLRPCGHNRTVFRKRAAADVRPSTGRTARAECQRALPGRRESIRDHLFFAGSVASTVR